MLFLLGFFGFIAFCHTLSFLSDYYGKKEVTWVHKMAAEQAKLSLQERSELRRDSEWLAGVVSRL